MTMHTQASESLKSVVINGETFFKISNSDRLRPFFMSIVSASNHWMFIGSNGGLTAGRKNSEFALFPYYSDDKIVESTAITGPKTVIQLQHNNELVNWEPFRAAEGEKFSITRNLYKNLYGNKVAFEEINEDLNLTFRYEWSSSNLYGFRRTASISNTGDQAVEIRILDGLQNILPYGVGSDLQLKQSNLVDAYKRTELDEASGLGIFALSAIIVDRAEPSEALKANVAWQRGLDNPTYLLSSKQLASFKSGDPIETETDVKAEKGAFLIGSVFELASEASKEWIMVVDVNKNHAAVVGVIQDISSEGIEQRVDEDVELGTKELVRLTASADGIQKSADQLKDVRHFSNVMFNIMRGGIFDHNYQIEKWDILKYLQAANKDVFSKYHEELEGLEDVFSLKDLEALTENVNDPSFTRLLSEYLPLKFSRRHGDPSRPWNKFSINTRSEIDGSKILDYEGNWRDIFQNWEALAFAFPDFMEGMIFRFLNASTFDGYNPYRIMKHGFDWETIEPDDPWSFIGYWGDHQIIYLLKFLEFIQKHQPGRLQELFSQETFSYAAVPYRIKDYSEILKNPKDTIIFDLEWDAQIRASRDEIGSDGAMLMSGGTIYHVNFIEKILATTLAKLSNLVPDAGIWMNTQRPEWNDANNALVGNGVSMVTLYYLRRFLSFFEDILENSEATEVQISQELLSFFYSLQSAFNDHQGYLESGFDDNSRKLFMDALGAAATKYRDSVYNNGFDGDKPSLSLLELKEFFKVSNSYLEASIDSNEREDHLFHAYNIIDISVDSVAVSYLDEMLEGQVAVLSSGYLSAEQVLRLMDSLRKSRIYRDDQNSYILYPNKELKGFMDRNQVPVEAIEKSALLKALIENNNALVIEKDAIGNYHFNGGIRNGFELDNALDELDHEEYGKLVENERSLIQSVYEQVFNHKTFTGRSGTFYGYEGLGSIYWHMVSKLLLALEECTIEAVNSGAAETDALKAHCNEVFEGIGVHKSPDVYGAFSIDPYSHTPFTKGAQQPGMTGQVKEDVISRILELGVNVIEGRIRFEPTILNDEEFIQEPVQFEYVDIEGMFRTIDLESDSLAFTYCQVPVVYQRTGSSAIKISFTSGDTRIIDGNSLDYEISRMIFGRTGAVEKLVVSISS